MRELRVKIRIAGNTATPCYSAILKKGYEVTISVDQSSDDSYIFQYDATKEDLFFSATSPEELLGLIHMWEIRGDNWRGTKEEIKLFRTQEDNAPIYDIDGNLIEGE